MKSKKAQEEIVGFVAIVVIVAVVFVIFLGISLRQEPKFEKESKDISRFLKSSMEYTTDCARGYEPNYAKLSELMSDCYNGKQCLSQKRACQVLNETLLAILDASWKVGEERAIKGYIFDSRYSYNVSEESEEEIILIEKGNCSSGTIRGAEDFYALYPGSVSYSLKICY